LNSKPLNFISANLNQLSYQIINTNSLICQKEKSLGGRTLHVKLNAFNYLM